jgi:PIN domain nuclease of toxin-antitoxin system
MIVLDTHAWIWWAHGDEQLTTTQVDAILANEKDVIGISAISCWKVAKLVEYKRLVLPCVLQDCFEQALHYPGIRLISLTPEIVIESTQLPGEFHRDPADQIIVATARMHNCPLVTADSKIQSYPYVQTIA